MDFWLLSVWDVPSGSWVVINVLFNAELVEANVYELLTESDNINSVKVERWNRETDSDEAEFYSVDQYWKDDILK